MSNYVTVADGKTFIAGCIFKDRHHSRRDGKYEERSIILNTMAIFFTFFNRFALNFVNM